MRSNTFGDQTRTIIGDKLFSGKAWTIERIERSNGTRFYQLTELVGQYRTDFPVFYEHNQTVAYDRPERLPASVKAWVAVKLACDAGPLKA